MLKRTSNKKQDVNQYAKQIVDISTGQIGRPAPSAEEISAVMRAMGSKGGKIGGKHRAENMTAKERSKAASKAANAKWEKVRKHRS